MPPLPPISSTETPSFTTTYTWESSPLHHEYYFTAPLTRTSPPPTTITPPTTPRLSSPPSIMRPKNQECPEPQKSSKSSKMPRNIGSNEDPPGIDDRHLSDTPNFIRGLHGEYLVSWGPFSSAFAINPRPGSRWTTNDPYPLKWTVLKKR
jgi:hypothetical protein